MTRTPAHPRHPASPSPRPSSLARRLSRASSSAEKQPVNLKNVPDERVLYCHCGFRAAIAKKASPPVGDLPGSGSEGSSKPGETAGVGKCLADVAVVDSYGCARPVGRQALGSTIELKAEERGQVAE